MKAFNSVQVNNENSILIFPKGLNWEGFMPIYQILNAENENSIGITKYAYDYQPERDILSERVKYRSKVEMFVTKQAQLLHPKVKSSFLNEELREELYESLRKTTLIIQLEILKGDRANIIPDFYPNKIEKVLEDDTNLDYVIEIEPKQLLTHKNKQVRDLLKKLLKV